MCSLLLELPLLHYICMYFSVKVVFGVMVNVSFLVGLAPDFFEKMLSCLVVTSSATDDPKIMYSVHGLIFVNGLKM